jgi:hypothetical protein
MLIIRYLFQKGSPWTWFINVMSAFCRAHVTDVIYLVAVCEWPDYRGERTLSLLADGTGFDFGRRFCAAY